MLGARSESTLFISQIPGETTHESLESLFSNHGPIKSCFILADKLVGFVKFVDPEDARRVASLKSLVFGTSRVFIEFAKRRHRLGDKAAPVKQVKPKLAGDYVVWAMIHSSISKKVAYKKFRKFGSCDIELHPISHLPSLLSSKPTTATATTDEPCKSGMQVAKISYSSVSESDSALHLHNHVFKGHIVYAYKLQSPRAAVLKATSKLVLRNLDFKISANDIVVELLPFGLVVDINVPSVVDGGNKGYAFVVMGGKRQAECVVEGLNGKVIGKRVVAVDFALNKDAYEKVVSDRVPVEVEEQLQEEEEEVSQDEDVKECEDEDEDDALVESDVHVSIDPELVKDKSKKVEDLSGTIFVRNVPFTATESDLSELFSQFGKVSYARIVYNENQLPKGTAFVRFVNSESAQSAIEAGNGMSNDHGEGVMSNMDIIMNSSKGHIKPETQGGIEIAGRILQVSSALSKSQAPAEKPVEKEKSDKRNIYLLKEGYVSPTSSAAADLPKTQLEARYASYMARTAKLKKNLHLFVSRTRLSIRNLGKIPDEKFLRTMALKEVDEWRKEVETYTGRSERIELEKLKKDGFSSAIRVVQVKLVRDTKKADEKKGASLGYGFIEFSNHAHALGFLRRVNNNPSLVQGGRRALVEFAIENSVILKKRAGMFREGAGSKKSPKNVHAEKKSEVKSVVVKQVEVKKQPLAKPLDQKKPVKPAAKAQKQPVKRKRTEDDFDALVMKYQRRLAKSE